MSPTGANTFSPMNAACLATVTIPSGSFDLCARIAWIMIEAPPPTQTTAKSTCTALNNEYQLFIRADELENAKITPMTATAARIPYVRVFDPRLDAAEPAAGVS